MKLSVIGCGYLGAVHAVAMCLLGHEVVGVDVDAAKVEQLAAGRMPFHEPGLPEALAEALGTGRLRFTTDVADAAGCRAHFLTVGTPERADGGAADLSFVDAAMKTLVPVLAPGSVVIGKSTVPVGTAVGLAAQLAPAGALLAWNPEFLREGYAYEDTVRPDRIVYGLPPDEADAGRARAVLDEIYAVAIAAKTPVLATDYATAELVKVAANAFLATKISFINGMAEVAEIVDADVTVLADAIGLDPRIGRRFLNAGVGFGGGCLPKDLRAFQARAEELGAGQAVAFLREVDAINLRRRQRVVELVLDALSMSDLRGDGKKKVAVLGLSFKPDSDDVRDSPALDVAAQLHERGVAVAAYDPSAVPNARKRQPQLTYTASAGEALTGADVVVLLTEWREFRALDPAATASLVRTPVLIDARNFLDADAWRAAGWTYVGLGRGRPRL